MRKLLLRLSFAALSFSLVADPALADARGPAGFFESLFGAPRFTRTKRVRRPFYDDRTPWWQRRPRNQVKIYGGYDSFDQGNQSYRKRKRKAVADYADPEAIPGLGMGNPDYIPPKLVSLVDPSITKLVAADIAVPDIAMALSNARTAVRVEQSLRQPIVDLYKTAEFKPFWLDGNKVSDRAKTVLAYAASTADQGLEPADYLPDALNSFQDIDAQLDGDPKKLARFDVSMTAATLKLALHLSGGRFDPNRLSLYNDLDSQKVNPTLALNVLAHSPYADTYLKGLEPKHPAYGLMRDELAKLTNGGPLPEATKIADGKTVKQGRSDPRIIEVRQRLQSLGYIGADVPLPDPEFAAELDEDLSIALKAFQKDMQIKQNGRLDSATVRKLNRDDPASDIRRLVVNLERMRWLPKDLGKRHVFVNQPEFAVHVMDGGKEVWRSNVIIGRPMTQTASFNDEMETVVFNPSWGVPQSIIVNEYLAKLRRDPGYLDRQGFKVVNQKGKVISSRAVNWYAYDSSNPLGVQQPPGDGNALGELKFLFPNKHDIYMHDTPTRKLFSESIRTFSHGCVRVQNPREFASVLLGWDAAKVDRTTDSKESQSVKLPQKLPIHIAYFTAWPDSAGKMQYFNDVYGRDEAMERAVKIMAAQRDALQAQKLVQN
jgi:L,D-transpeptidase YcbB